MARRPNTMSQASYPLDPSVPLGFVEKWSFNVQLQILIYFSCCYIALCLLPNQIWNSEAREFVYVIGILGVWRYTWNAAGMLVKVVLGLILLLGVAYFGVSMWSGGKKPSAVQLPQRLAGTLTEFPVDSGSTPARPTSLDGHPFRSRYTLVS